MTLYVDIEKQCGDFFLKVKLEVRKEVLAILGASGCGKSLTLKCIAGIEKPDRGVIRLDDKVLFDSEKRINLPSRKRHIGYLFQEYALFPNMTVLQNIMCGTGSKERAQELVQRFYLTGKEGLYPAQLSGGQKQRTAIARMLGAEPEVILLDEPFSALDNHLKMQLERELVKVLDTVERPVLFVSHDRNEVYRLTERIAVMEEGHVVETRAKRELFSHPRTLAGTLLTGCKNVTRLEETENPDEYWAKDWGIRLRKPGEDSFTPEAPRYAGFRAHYFQAVPQMEETNVVECEIERVIEDTFSTILLFRHGGCRENGDFSLLTYELPKDEWERIKGSRLYLKMPEEMLIWIV